MKWVLILAFALSIISCTTSADELDCTRMVTCSLISCDGSVFGSVEVEACHTDRFENGCCPVLEEVTCRCPE